MTALSGVVGGHNPLDQCLGALAAQAAYGSQQTFHEAGTAAAFGASPSNPSADRRAFLGAAADRWLVACDLRLDNSRELRATLGVAADHGDAELVLAAWMRWGDETPDRLLGDFAIAIFDADKRALTLARDPTGQVPLFFRTSPVAAFASMPGGLRSLGGIRSGLNPQTVALHLSNQQTSTDETFFEGIHSVRPGEIVQIRDGLVDRRFYWAPSLGADRNRTTAELIEEYRQLLAAAVAGRMGEASIGAHLSSGLDSSAVASTAAILLKRSGLVLSAFTSAPLEQARNERTRHSFADESQLAALTAQLHAMRHIVVRETAPLADVINRQTRLVQAPLWDPVNMSWWTEIRSRAVDLGVTRILTGESGNMTLNAGGLGTLAAYLHERGIRSWWSEARAARAQGGVRWRGVMINSFGSLLPTFAWTALHRLFLRHPRTKRGFLRREWGRRVRDQAVRIGPSGNPAADRLAALRRGDLGAYRKAAEADRGVAELDPLSDRRLIEFGLRLPPEVLYRNGVSKPLARAALADRVPREVLAESSRGMQGADWHLRIDQQAARDLFEEAAASNLFRDLVDLQAVEGAINSWPQGDWNEFPAAITYRNAIIGTLAAGAFIRIFEREG